MENIKIRIIFVKTVQCRVSDVNCVYGHYIYPHFDFGNKLLLSFISTISSNTVIELHNFCLWPHLLKKELYASAVSLILIVIKLKHPTLFQNHLPK